MTSDGKKGPGKEEKTSLFTRMVDKAMDRNPSSETIIIECGSWSTLYAYFMGEGATPGDVTAFSDYAKESPRFRCEQTGTGLVKVAIRRNRV